MLLYTSRVRDSLRYLSLKQFDTHIKRFTSVTSVCVCVCVLKFCRNTKQLWMKSACKCGWLANKVSSASDLEEWREQEWVSKSCELKKELFDYIFHSLTTFLYNWGKQIRAFFYMASFPVIYKSIISFFASQTDSCKTYSTWVVRSINMLHISFNTS